MKIDNVNAVPAESLRVEGAGVGSLAVSRQESEPDREAVKSTSPLKKDTRSAEEVRRDVEAINEQLTLLNQSLQFRIDEDTRDVVIRVVDKDSGEVIKQIPPEEIMKLRRRLSEMSSLFVEKTV
jgi:flagellar protein FlaG